MNPDRFEAQLKEVFHKNLEHNRCIFPEGISGVDHVAFRSLGYGHSRISELQVPLFDMGFVPVGKYTFEEKNLRAVHYEIPGQNFKVFLSEYNTSRSIDVFGIVSNIYARSLKDIESLYPRPGIFMFNEWSRYVKIEEYEKLKEHSEYLAWTVVNGCIPNHFGWSCHDVETCAKQTAALNTGNIDLTVNDRNGIVRGSRDVLLEQSSTNAYYMKKQFMDGELEVPTVFFEFVTRYSERGSIQPFNGFLAENADKIFESTNTK
jgi:hypothetical protein